MNILKSCRDKRPEVCIAYASLAIAIFFVLMVISWSLFPIKIAEIESPAKLITPQVIQGENLKYIVDGCIYAESEISITRKFVNDLMFFTPSISTNSQKGCFIDIVSIEVPAHLPAGKYHLEICETYKLNPVRSEMVNWQTEDFEIISKEEI